MSSWKSKFSLGVGLAAAMVAFTAAPANASPAPNQSPTLKVIKTLSSSFVGPLQFAVAGPKVFVADSFTSTLSVIGRSTPIATGPSPADGGDLAGVAVDPAERALAYTTSNGDHSVTALTILQKGHKPVVADISGFEAKYNPDGTTQYGISNPSQCVTDSLTSLGIPVQYNGLVDSHPYAVTSIGHGAWAVADAGGNDLLKVDRYGRVSLIAVLPAQPVKITAAFAAASGVAACAVGFTYKFEPVPTDVEVGPGGGLFVTTLPGGPEGPDNGNPGSVYAIGSHGTSHRIATGFQGATNLAIDSRGHVFVAEISSGTISEVVCGKPKEVISLPGVVGVEFANGHLYASTAPAASGLSGPGSIVELGTAG